MGTHELITKFNPQKYIKLIAMLAGAVASGLVAVSTTGGHLGTAEYINLAIAAVGAFHVWYGSETVESPNAKSVFAFVTTGLMVASSLLITGGALHIADIAQILVAALAATGVLATPTTALARRALPASYSNNTVVVNAGTPVAATVPQRRPDGTQWEIKS